MIKPMASSQLGLRPEKKVSGAIPQFTICQAVAWIIWRDPNHPLRQPRPPIEESEAMRGWWDGSANSERQIRDAAGELAVQISAGLVCAAGWRMAGKMPLPLSGDADYVDHIPAGNAQQIISVPLEWLELSEGGCLLLNDKIRNGVDEGLLFSRVTVDATAVKSIWPATSFSPADEIAPEKPADAESYKSGFAGHPTSMHLIESELLERQKAGRTLQTKVAEAKALSDWLRTTHPKAPPAMAKTITNSLFIEIGHAIEHVHKKP